MATRNFTNEAEISEEDQKTLLELSMDLIESAIIGARFHSQGHPNSRPKLVAVMLQLIHAQTEHIKNYQWPDPMKRAAEAASKDKALQKLIKTASRKKPITD